MNCPKCASEMIPRVQEELTVFECPQGHGAWFEKDALRQAKDITNSDLKWIDIDLWKDKDLYRVTESSFLCPTCQKKMATVNYGETNVMVDTCPNCEGIWLDKGEFKQIVQALEDEITSLTADDYRSAALKQAKEIVTGPESMISEWRDFRTVFRLMQYRMMVENPKLQNTLLNMQRESPFK